jgi:hypothetical protein
VFGFLVTLTIIRSGRFIEEERIWSNNNPKPVPPELLLLLGDFTSMHHRLCSVHYHTLMSLTLCTIGLDQWKRNIHQILSSVLVFSTYEFISAPGSNLIPATLFSPHLAFLTLKITTKREHATTAQRVPQINAHPNSQSCLPLPSPYPEQGKYGW